jgi:hypothetical protein
LGGNDKTSNNNNNGGSAGDDRDGRGDNGRKAGWEEDNRKGEMTKTNLSSTTMIVRMKWGERGGRTTMRTTSMRTTMIMTLGGAVDWPRGAGQ